MNNFDIIPECYADTVLMETLGFKRPNHQSGIGAVLKVFEKNFKNRLAIGIIDDDKRKPRHFDMFQLADEKRNIKKMTNPGSQHVIFVVCPAFEDWVFQNAKAVEVNPGRFDFRSPRYFRKVCKRMDAPQSEKLKQFFNALRQRRAPGFIQLADWIKELKSK